MKSLEDDQIIVHWKRRLKQIKYLMKYSTLTQYTQLSYNLLELVSTCILVYCIFLPAVSEGKMFNFVILSKWWYYY